MIVTVLKTTFQSLPRKIRSYMNLIMECYGRVYLMTFKRRYWKPWKICKGLRKYIKQSCPSKKKYIRGNHLPFTNKELSKTVINRTTLRNVYSRKRSDENRKKYSKQRNYCALLLRRTKWKHYSSSAKKKKKKITDNKKFWRTVKQFLSEISPSNEKITLIVVKLLVQITK